MKWTGLTKAVSKVFGTSFFLVLFYFAVFVLYGFVSPAHAKFDDDFSGSEIETEWGVKYEHVLMPSDWKYSVNKSNLNVTDVKDRSVNNKWSTVSMSRSFGALSDFNADIAFSWDI